MPPKEKPTKLRASKNCERGEGRRPAAGSAWEREQIALANADYEHRRAADPTQRLNMRKVEREWKLKPGQLVSYRANRKKRSDSGVTRLFGGTHLVTKLVREIDHVATGERMRKCRCEAKISLREMARRLGYSAPFLSDLELGRRNWSQEIAGKYAAIIHPQNVPTLPPAANSNEAHDHV